VEVVLSTEVVLSVGASPVEVVLSVEVALSLGTSPVVVILSVEVALSPSSSVEVVLLGATTVRVAMGLLVGDGVEGLPLELVGLFVEVTAMRATTRMQRIGFIPKGKGLGENEFHSGHLYFIGRARKENKRGN
jgi:hypothetical protein